jgi:choline monooxygenase
VEESMKISDEIQREDEFVSERVQEGLNSSGYEVGRYAPNVEMAEYHFHQLLYKDLLNGVEKEK